MTNKETDEEYRTRVDAEDAARAKDIDHQLGPEGWIAGRGSPFSGYYIHFDETGVPEVDLILKAIAAAGKSYHHTDSWSERRNEGEASCTDLIQEAANRAARELRERRRVER